jgi:HPt (histidine-containing phosphotransfer) domain-containing protein
MPAFFISLLPQLLLLLLLVLPFVQFLKDTMVASEEQWQQQLLAGEYCNITDLIYSFQNQHITTLHQSTIN